MSKRLEAAVACKAVSALPVIAIHHRPSSYSDRWIEYCQEHSIEFKLVDGYADDIIRQLSGCAAFMWHFRHDSPSDMLIARSVLRAAEALGLKVFPDERTSWHFDNKVAQKYLLEAVGTDGVPSYVFSTKEAAQRWVNEAEFPKVFKLSSGAGSYNVRLVHSRSHAAKLVKKAFGGGFPPFPRWQPFRERVWQLRRDRSGRALVNVLRGLYRAVWPNRTMAKLPRHFDYVYFQDFIPNNDSDVRVMVVGERVCAAKRSVRDGDFRASGSGKVIYQKDLIPKDCLALGLELSKKIKAQALAIDFVFDQTRPLVVEISFGSPPAFYFPCPGYWDSNMQWVEGAFRVEDFMIQDLLQDINLTAVADE